MLPCASLATILFVFMFILYANVNSAKENDTAVVGSLLHETKIKPPADMLTASSSKDHYGGDAFGDEHANEGYFNSQGMNDGDGGYDKFNSYHMKDGDSYGYKKHYSFDKRKGGNKKKDGLGSSFHDDDNFDFDNDDEATHNLKYSPLHYEESSSESPSKRYRFENDDTGKTKGKLVGPYYEDSRGDMDPKRHKRKKEQQADATEYDNYETYGDIEDADDVEADDGEPEYGAVYADADAYDYY